MKKSSLVTALAVAGLSVGAAAVAFSSDLGTTVETQLSRRSLTLFGVRAPVDESSTLSLSQSVAEAYPRFLATVARGLRVRVVTSSADAGANVDMMALWPDDQYPTHLIVCNEQGTSEPGVQRIRLSDGLVETILTGTSSCDPVHRTPWGTILVAEEAGNSGQAIEILDPLHTTGVSFDRVAGTASGGTGADNVASRWALGRLSFEGVGIYPNGVVYYGDENRPSQGTPGGAYFKFIPTSPWTGGPAITDLGASPLADGAIYGLRLGKRSGNTDYGQGSNTGLGTWVEIMNPFNADLRQAAADLKLTGYYRPEDLSIDQQALAGGAVRFCANNTGNEGSDRNWGEAVCVTDGTLEEATANEAIPEVQLFVVGTPELAMMDNMAYQPGRRNWILMEDGDGPEVGRNNDMWACLEDGPDEDSLSDGCIRIATLNDLEAEWTGGLFDAFGKRFFVSVQHNVTGHGVVLEITGWR